MKVLYVKFIYLLLIVLVAGAQEPSVLFCTQRGRPGALDFDYLRELRAAGFAVDYTESWDEVTAERLRQYQVLVIPGWVWLKGKQVFSHSGVPLRENRPDPATIRKLVKEHLDAGGGVLLAATRVGASPALWAEYNAMLADYGARLPMERIVAPPDTMALQSRLHDFPFFYTTNVAASPVSEGVHGVWWPNIDRGRGHNWIRYSGLLDVDDSWQVVLRAPKGSRTIHHVPRSLDQFNPAEVIPNPYYRPEGVADPPLFAIRDRGPGRLALYHCLSVFHLGSGTSWLHDGAMLNTGLAGKPSDFDRLLRNTLRWLGEPARRAGKLGGAEIPDDRLIPKVMTEWGKTRFGDPRYPRIDAPDAPFREPPLRKGLVGARTAYSGGQGSVADYAKAAAAAGLDFVIFLEDYRELTPAELTELAADCAAVSTPELALFPGYRMDTNLGIQAAFFGEAPIWPPDYVLSKRVPGAYKLQGETPDGEFTERKNEALDFNLSHFLGRDVADRNNIVFFDFTRHAAAGAPQLEHCRIFGGGGIVLYDHGTFVEDVTSEYLRTNAGTMSCVPFAIDLVDSPAALREAVAAGHALTYVAAKDAAAVMRAGLHKNHQLSAPPVSVSSGPEILLYTAKTTPVVFGADCFCAGLSVGDIELSVRAQAGLADISIFDGERLWRRFRPGGTEFRIRLYVDAFRQRTLGLVVTDRAGGKAVAFPYQTWKHGAAHQVLFCGDHVNHCTSVNMKMAHGPMGWPMLALPPVAAAGFTWDGGPQPYSPLIHWPGIVPNMQAADGTVQNQSPYQYPVLIFADEGCYRGKSVMVGQCRVRGNPWSGWGPIDPAPLAAGWSIYTEFARYVEGADPTGWGGPGLEHGSVASLYEQELTFTRDATLKRFRLVYDWRDADDDRAPTFVVGRGTEVAAAETCPVNVEEGRGKRLAIPTGGWLAGIIPAGGNCFLTVNRGVPLEFVISGKMAGLDVALPAGGLTVTAGEAHRVEFFNIVWPLSVPIPDAAALTRMIAWLSAPAGLEIKRGDLLPTGSPGLLEIAARDHVAVYGVPAPPADVPPTTLSVRVSGLNPNWDCGLWQRQGFAGSGLYHDGREVYTTLGLDADGRAYVPVYAPKAPFTAHVVGHPVVADGAGADLFVTAIPLNGPWPPGETGTPVWHVAVNNPTDAAVTATLRQAMPVPGLELSPVELTLAPGEYRVLIHDTPPEKPKK